MCRLYEILHFIIQICCSLNIFFIIIKNILHVIFQWNKDSVELKYRMCTWCGQGSASSCFKTPNTLALQIMHLAGKRKCFFSSSCASLRQLVSPCNCGVAAALVCKGQWRGTSVVLLIKWKQLLLGQLASSGFFRSILFMLTWLIGRREVLEA